MMKKSYYINHSCFFVNMPTILFAFIMSFIAFHYQMKDISIVLMILSSVGLTAFIWAHLSLRNIELKVIIDQNILSPGEKGVVNFKILNNKWVPIISIMIRMIVPPRNFIIPTNKSDYRSLDDIEISKARLSKSEVKYVLEKKFAFLKGFALISWDIEWEAQARGLFHLENIELYSGDGFGLMESYKEIELCKNHYIIVCPQRIKVNESLFNGNNSICDYGVKGHFDDETLIKQIREYQQHDDIRNMNWKLLAQGQVEMINVYEKANSKKIHLFFDGESFNGEKPKLYEMEKSLQIIYSIIVEMNELGMSCGLSLPKSELFDAVYLDDAGNSQIEEAFYYISGYNLLPLKNDTENDNMPVLMEHSSLATVIIEARKIKLKKENSYFESTSKFSSSDQALFDEGIDEYYYFTYDYSSFVKRDTKILKSLYHKNLIVVCCEVDKTPVLSRVSKDDPEDIAVDCFRVIKLSSLRGDINEGAE